MMMMMMMIMMIIIILIIPSLKRDSRTALHVALNLLTHSMEQSPS